MKTIYKYGPFKPGSTCRVVGTVVHFGIQDDELYIWAMLNDPASNSYDVYEIIGTGWITNRTNHYGTVVTPQGFVWHLMR